MLTVIIAERAIMAQTSFQLDEGTAKAIPRN